jgi:hypothetical protein
MSNKTMKAFRGISKRGVIIPPEMIAWSVPYFERHRISIVLAGFASSSSNKNFTHFSEYRAVFEFYIGATKAT